MYSRVRRDGNYLIWIWIIKSDETSDKNDTAVNCIYRDILTIVLVIIIILSMDLKVIYYL